MKPYVYVDTYKHARDFQRNAPEGARVAVHYPDIGRTVELMTDVRGRWSVSDRPAPGHGGTPVTVASGELQDDPHPQAPLTLSDVHASPELTAMLEQARTDMIADDEEWARLACGQDTEEAEESGRLAGYIEGLEAALKLIMPAKQADKPTADEIADVGDVSACHDDCRHPNLDHEAEGQPCETAKGQPLFTPAQQRLRERLRSESERED